MVPMTGNARSYQDYRWACKQYNIRFLNRAINSNNLPGRLEHIWVFLKASAAFPVSTLGRIVACIYVIPKNLIKIIIPVEFNQKKYLLIEIRNELLHLISCIAIQFLRLGSSVVGILSPETAARGWEVAEQIDAYCWRKKTDCQSQFISLMWQSPETGPLPQPHRLPLRFFSAQLYLGTQRVNTIAQQLCPYVFTPAQDHYAYTPLTGKDSNEFSFGPQLHQESIIW